MHGVLVKGVDFPRKYVLAFLSYQLLMVESLSNSLENVRAMVLQLREELRGYASEMVKAHRLFSSENNGSHIRLFRKSWKACGIKNPPFFVPFHKVPSLNKISRIQDLEELNVYVETLLNTLRFLRLLRSVKNELPASKGPELSIKIIGENIERVGTVSNAIRDAITRVLPLVLTHFSGLENAPGFVHETIDFKYIDGYDKELQNAVVETRIAIIAQNMGFEFDEEKMVVNIV